ncbi:MAG: hypothetical protein DSY32_03280 [Aquifex sp.]|nr:MAG: hypothetical protein DSY32_03280 [Aquifex sp.]
MGVKNSILGYLLSGLLHGAILFSLTYTSLEMKEEKPRKVAVISLKTLKIKKEEKKDAKVKTINKKTIKGKKRSLKKKRKVLKKKKAVKRSKKVKRKRDISKKILRKVKKVRSANLAKPEKIIKNNVKTVAKSNTQNGVKGKAFHKKTVKESKQVAFSRMSEDYYRKNFLSINFEKIRSYVQENVKYPYIARRMGWEGKVILEIVLSKRGCESVRVVRSSGHKILDNNALETVKALCGKFPRPEKKVKLRLPISYILR